MMVGMMMMMVMAGMMQPKGNKGQIAGHQGQHGPRGGAQMQQGYRVPASK